MFVLTLPTSVGELALWMLFGLCGTGIVAVLVYALCYAGRVIWGKGDITGEEDPSD